MQPSSTSRQSAGTISSYFMLAGKERAGNPQGQFCIHLAPGNKEVKFYAPVADRVNSEEAWKILRASIQSELQSSLPPPDAKEMQELTDHILGSVMNETPRNLPPSFDALKTLTENTREMVNKRDAIVAKFRELDRQLSAVKDDDFWVRTMPAAPVTTIMTFDLHLCLSRPEGPLPAGDFRFNLHVLEQFLRLVAVDSFDLKVAVDHLKKSEALQHAFVETCSAILHEPCRLPLGGEVGLVRLLLHVEKPAVDQCFLSRAAFERLCAAQDVAEKLKGPRPLERDGITFLTLKRNMERYETCVAAGAIPRSLAKASRRFVVEMTERLEGRFQPLSAPNEGFLLDRLAKVVSDAQEQPVNKIARGLGFDNFQNVPEAHVQNSFGATCMGNLLQAALSNWAEASHSQVRATARFLACFQDTDVEHVYVDTATLRDLRRAIERAIPGSTEFPQVSRNLGMLERNARTYDACSKSEVFHDPAFDDVPLELFVPWWSAMQAHLQARSEAASSSASSSSTSSTLQADPVVFHAASNEPTPSTEPSPEAAAPTAQVKPAPERKEPSARTYQAFETKQPADRSQPRSGGALIPAHVHVPLAPNTNKGSAPTGREWWNALKKQTEHHLPGTQKHLPRWMQDLFGGRRGHRDKHGQAVTENRAKREK